MEHEKLLQALEQAASILNDWAGGNLRTVVARADVPFFASMQRMHKQLCTMIADIRANVASLEHSSDELSRLSASMMENTRGMNERALAVAESTSHMSDSMNTISAAAEEISVNMNTVSAQAEGSSQKVNDVTHAMGEMTGTITEIAGNAENARRVVHGAVASVQQATSRMNDLAKAARGINQVTLAISGISDQTKLLALNATIEAARAGEAGLRFGVVAKEVKSLAGETSKATRDIHNHVKTMQTTTGDALQEIQNITSVMEEVSQIVDTIATAVEEQSATAGEISSNLRFVSDGISEMSREVNEAAGAVQEVTTNITRAAMLATESAEDISEVSAQSTRMRQDAVVQYAGAMEMASRTADIQRSAQQMQIPSTYDTSASNELFRFGELYSVLVNDLDNEHRGIFDYINRIHAAIKDRADQSMLLPILRDMYAWTRDHFAHEEKLMQQVRYAELPAQKRAHQKLLGDVMMNIDKIDRGEEVNLIELLVFLKNWLVQHIMGMDKKYSTPMNQGGIH